MNAAQIAASAAGDGVAPAAPTNVTATAVSSSQINLAWNANSSATSYDVLRSKTNGGFYTIIATGVTATNYSDTALTGSTTYYYVVSALNNAGASTNSTQASATTLMPPGVPTGFTATGVFSGQIYSVMDGGCRRDELQREACLCQRRALCHGGHRRHD